MRFIGYRGRDLIRFAYQIPEARVIGGPRWLDEEILNIVINLDAAPRADEMPGIVREALESRLQLKTHMEKRNFPVLALVMAQARPRVRTRGCASRAGRASTCSSGSPPGNLGTNSRSGGACRLAAASSTAPLGWTQHCVDHDAPDFADEPARLCQRVADDSA